MKKIILISTILLGIILASSDSVFAEVVDTKVQQAQLELTENDDPSVSKLSITQVSNLDFGKQGIGITEMKFTASNVSVIQVTDIRGDAPGWTLSVSLGEFKTSQAEDANTLRGVELFYPSTVMTTTSGAIDPQDRTPESISTDSAFSADTIKGVVVSSSATPNSKTLFNASKLQGNGQWTANYGVGKVELKVPSGNLAGAYSADLTYTLADGPKGTD